MKIPTKAGYTHKISWVENHQHLGKVNKSFNTTKDALRIHIPRLKQSQAEGLVVEYEVTVL